MGTQLRMTADVRAWLADLCARDPAAAYQAGAAVLALLDQGPDLGPPLVATVPVTWGWHEDGPADPRDALDEAYQEMLEGLSMRRREAAGVATRRAQVESELNGAAASMQPSETAELLRSHAELTRREERLAADAQQAHLRLESFRGRKEAAKAALTAAEAMRAIHEAVALTGDTAGISLTGAETALADAHAQAQALLSEAGRPDAEQADAEQADAEQADAGRADAERPDAGRADAERLDAGRADAERADAGRLDAGRAARAEVPDATAQTGDAGQPAEAALQDAELMVLRPAAPGCLATRIMFMLAPAGGPRRAAADGIGHTARTAAAGGSESSYAEYAGTESGSTESGRTESSGTESSGTGSEIVLLAAGTEHAGPGSGPDRLIALALARAAEGPASISYGGDDFVDVFFPDQEHELLREVTALATASQPQGLADVRELLELTQEQMALRLGVDPARVREIESDEPAATDLPTLAAYVEALGGRLDLSVDLGTERIQLG